MRFEEMIARNEAMMLDALENTVSNQLLEKWNMQLGQANLMKTQKARIIGRLRKQGANRPSPSAIRDLSRHEQSRRRLTQDLRAIHLARAFLRDTPYDKVEQSCRDNNQPSIYRISLALGGQYDEGEIELWLKKGEPEFEHGAVTFLAQD